MKLNKIKLKNIRSYIDQEIEFPEKTTLLAGDVGSGKSTILLAIDFALFGLQRGSLSGSALLRNGTNSGSVELSFEIDNIPIIIKRTLKRESTITQDSGYIIINGERKDLTAQELKQKILELLNYPQELLTKSKSLIYRYTVYTPQEEMKQILLGDKDSRLDALRRVFGIDKYKRIQENSDIFINYLKQNSKELEGKTSDLNDKKIQYENKTKEINQIKSNLEVLKPKLLALNSSLKVKKEDISKIEKELKNLQEIKHKLNLHELNLKNKTEKKENSQIELEEINFIIKELKSKLKEIKPADKEIIKELENSINLFETTIKTHHSKLAEFNTKLISSKEIIEKISKLDICPLCKQKVTQEHIKEVKDQENNSIKELNLNISTYEKQLKEAEHKLKEYKGNLEAQRQLVSQEEAIKLKQYHLLEKEKLKDKLEKEIQTSINDIQKLNSDVSSLKSEIHNFKDLEKTYEISKEELEDLQNKIKLLEIEEVGYKKELSVTNDLLSILQKEIEEKQGIKKQLAKQKQLQSWLQEHFLNLILVIEKKIMFKVHSDFNSLFQRWFDLVMDNELLKIKLDEEFTPFIEQANHELDYEYLSGGEKTATALAYRLALNQIINTLVSTIKTKDLLILDEPTDGFSSEQLDRIKLVLDQLDAKQIIIVSHESKIESFVNNIIKLNKKEHTTEIIKN